MKIRKTALIIAVLTVISMAGVLFCHSAPQTCVVLMSPAAVTLYGSDMSKELRSLQWRTWCRYVVCSDESEEMVAAFLEKQTPDFVVLTGEQLQMVPTVRTVSGNARIAVALFNQIDNPEDGVLIAIPDYARIETDMADLYSKSGDRREFVFAGVPSGLAEYTSQFSDSSKAFGILTSISPEFLPSTAVLYADPGILGLMPGIIDNLRKLSIGSVNIMPIIKKMPGERGK